VAPSSAALCRSTVRPEIRPASAVKVTARAQKPQSEGLLATYRLEGLMRRILITSAAAYTLMAGLGVTSARAQAGDPAGSMDSSMGGSILKARVRS
jgi:hypothetical protein